MASTITPLTSWKKSHRMFKSPKRRWPTAATNRSLCLPQVLFANNTSSITRYWPTIASSRTIRSWSSRTWRGSKKFLRYWSLGQTGSLSRLLRALVRRVKSIMMMTNMASYRSLTRRYFSLPGTKIKKSCASWCLTRIRGNLTKIRWL